MLTRSPQVEALARVRCARCERVYAIVGDAAEAILYRLFFSGLRLGERVEATCKSCHFNSATISDAGYVMPALVK